MLVCKLSTGQIVRFLKGPCSVQFAQGEHVLVSDHLTMNPNRNYPHWVLSTYVMWMLRIPE